MYRFSVADAGSGCATPTQSGPMLEPGCKPGGYYVCAVYRTHKQRHDSGADRSPIKSMQVERLLPRCVRTSYITTSLDQSTGEGGWQNNGLFSLLIRLSFSYALWPYPPLFASSSSSLTHPFLHSSLPYSSVLLCHRGPGITPLLCLSLSLSLISHISHNLGLNAF